MNRINDYKNILKRIVVILITIFVCISNIRYVDADEKKDIDIKLAQTIQENLSLLSNGLTDSIDYSGSKYDNSISSVVLYAQKLKEDGIIKEYKNTDECVVLKFYSGLNMVYSPQPEGTYGGDKVASSKISVFAFQPFYSEIENMSDPYIDLPSGVSKEGEILEKEVSIYSDNLGELIDPRLSEKDHAISIEDIRNLKPNSIVIFQGHGVWAYDLHSTIETGNDFDWDAYKNDPIYRSDCDSGLIATYGEKEVITSKFIEKYCGDITNSFIYLGVCQGAYLDDDDYDYTERADRVLVDSFIAKGASAVVAFTKTTIIRYSDMFGYTFANMLSSINPSTSKHYKLSDALLKAKTDFGETDQSKRESSLKGSRALTFFKTGITDYSIDDAITNNVMSVNGLVFNGEVQKGVLEGVGYSLSGDIEKTYAGYYSGLATLIDDYRWPDGTTDPKTINWSISKYTPTASKLIPEANLTYNGEIQNLTPIVNDKIGTYYFKDNTSSWSNNPVYAKNVGTYPIDWYFKGVEGSSDDVGNEANPIEYYAQIVKGEYENIHVLMSDYHYGGYLPIPSLSKSVEDDPKVTYYYNKRLSAPPDFEWKNITSSSIEVGDYIIYAKIAESDNYKAYETVTSDFSVLERIIPKPDKGYIVPNTGVIK